MNTVCRHICIHTTSMEYFFLKTPYSLLQNWDRMLVALWEIQQRYDWKISMFTKQSTCTSALISRSVNQFSVATLFIMYPLPQVYATCNTLHWKELCIEVNTISYSSLQLCCSIMQADNQNKTLPVDKKTGMVGGVPQLAWKVS